MNGTKRFILLPKVIDLPSYWRMFRKETSVYTFFQIYGHEKKCKHLNAKLTSFVRTAMMVRYKTHGTKVELVLRPIGVYQKLLKSFIRAVITFLQKGEDYRKVYEDGASLFSVFRWKWSMSGQVCTLYLPMYYLMMNVIQLTLFSLKLILTLFSMSFRLGFYC